MRFQDFIIEDIQKAANEAFRYAAAVPEDKITWKPLESGRSVLDQAQEMAKCPDWAYTLVSGAEMGQMDEASMAAYKAEIAGWTTIETCKAECQKRLDKLAELYKNLPDERLLESKWLPYGGGRDFGMKEMMAYPSWNFTYHTGQIAYIQTLYGDTGMY
jgi:hypothetical protein